jgi:hypothetical protein
MPSTIAADVVKLTPIVRLVFRYQERWAGQACSSELGEERGSDKNVL